MKAVAEKLVCFHCGDSCTDDEVRLEEHVFCCEGCKTVYQLLKESDMCRYYSLDEHAGLKMDRPVAQGKYAFLDDKSLARPLFQFYSETDARVLFFTPSMHCASCIWLLERLYKLLPGVIESRVNFDRKEISVRFNPFELSLRQLVEKLSALGYEPSLGEKREDAGKGRMLLFRLGVAGFCAGNIMLFSFPEYLGMDTLSQTQFSALFRWLSAALSIPVVTFAAWPFFKKAWQGLKHRDLNIDFPLALGISALFIRSVLEITLGWGSGFFDSLAMLVFFLLIGRWLQDRAYESLSFERDFKSYFPLAAEVEGEEGTRFVKLQDLQVGDIIRVKSQELIPADSRIISGNARIDYSFVNGESTPETPDSGETLYAGGRQLDGLLRVQILRPVSQSYLSALWNQAEAGEENKGIKNFSDQVGRYFTLALVLIATATLVYWLPQDARKAFDAFTAVLIVACPCVLVVAAPFAFGNAMRWLSARSIFLKNPDTVEKVAQVDQVIFDKTGTLTEKSAEIELLWGTLTDEETCKLAGVLVQSLHPNSRLLFNHLNRNDFPQTDTFTEIPGKGLKASYGHEEWKVGSVKWITGAKGETESTSVLVARNNEPIAEFRLQWHFREGLDELFHTWTLPRYLYSGDKARGTEVLKKWFHNDHMFFGSSPEDKLRAVKNYRELGHHPMMVGDGLNDSGALKASWTGVAITDDVHAFTPACDVIMVGKSLHDLPRFIRFCKRTLQTVKFSFLFSLVYNLIWMSLAVRGELQPLVAALLMPVSSITVFTINTLGIRYFARKGGIQ